MVRTAILASALLLVGGVALWSQPNSRPPGLEQSTPETHPLGGAVPPSATTDSKQQPPATANVVPDGSLHFNPNQLDLRNEKGHWVLRSGSTWIKDFGADSLAARSGYQVIRQLHLTELVWVGKVEPSLEFFLQGDRPPPTPVGTGLPLITFQRQFLEAKWSDESWWLAEKGRPLLRFGDSREDAEKALALIHQYQINQVAYIEHPPMPMVLLAAATNQNAPQKTMPDGPKKTAPPREPSASFPPRQPAKPDVMSAFHRLTFTYTQAQVRQTSNQWQLVVGRAVLQEFGNDERVARDALKALQFYRFTEQYRFGDEEETFEFYLANGQAPHGRILGQSGIPFNPRDLMVRPSEGEGWIIYHDFQPLLRFKTKEHAEQAFEVIRRFRFDHLYRLGQPVPQIIYFTKEL
jgi:hypothetical protein